MLADGYVTDESGTGVVHSAPAFGEVRLFFHLVTLSSTPKQIGVHIFSNNIIWLAS